MKERKKPTGLCIKNNTSVIKSNYHMDLNILLLRSTSRSFHVEIQNVEKTVIFTCFGILKTFRWEYETIKGATSVYIKNNTSVNKSNTKMDEYIYI